MAAELEHQLAKNGLGFIGGVSYCIGNKMGDYQGDLIVDKTASAKMEDTYPMQASLGIMSFYGKMRVPIIRNDKFVFYIAGRLSYDLLSFKPENESDDAFGDSDEPVFSGGIGNGYSIGFLIGDFDLEIGQNNYQGSIKNDIFAIGPYVDSLSGSLQYKEIYCSLGYRFVLESLLNL